ncbi:pyridoxal phosphate-dependent aminotransferase [Candidatus Poribacteria bacterium]|nr:pyridoxal phosphate-dependent aminotransferase [Candidatus Poribacteria bacterium]
MISWWRIAFGDCEVEKLRESVQKECIGQGFVTEEFEEEISMALNVPFVVATTSGSAALYMALLSLGIGHGDEVIIPNRTWIASANAILLTGAKAVLVDVRSDLPLIDVSQIQSRITPQTKALMPVHLNGRSVDMRGIQQLAGKFGIPVIEDACQAFFSSNSSGYLGTQSDLGCFSLGLTKLVSTGQGGFVVTKNRDVYERLKVIRNHGVTDEFTESYDQFGFNFKFTDLFASFGLVQLSRVSKRIAHLNKIYAKYESTISKFKSLDLLPVNVLSGEIPLYAEVLCPERKELKNFLHFHNIQARIVPPDLNTSSCIKDDGSFPNSMRFSNQGLYLPCGPEQPLENIDFVIDALDDFEHRN